MWLAAVTFLFLFCFLPETSSANILTRRARRLRELTGNDRLRCHDEVEYAQTPLRVTAWETLVRPFVLNVEPIVLALNLYTSLIYALLYTWLESFSVVFEGVYGFKTGQEALSFLGLLVGALIAIPPFFFHLRYYLEPRFNAKNEIDPEERLLTDGGGLFHSNMPVHIWMDSTSDHTLDRASHRVKPVRHRHPAALPKFSDMDCQFIR